MLFASLVYSPASQLKCLSALCNIQQRCQSVDFLLSYVFFPIHARTTFNLFDLVPLGLRILPVYLHLQPFVMTFFFPAQTKRYQGRNLFVRNMDVHRGQTNAHVVLVSVSTDFQPTTHPSMAKQGNKRRSGVIIQHSLCTSFDTVGTTIFIRRNVCSCSALDLGPVPPPPRLVTFLEELLSCVSYIFCFVGYSF